MDPEEQYEREYQERQEQRRQSEKGKDGKKEPGRAGEALKQGAEKAADKGLQAAQVAAEAAQPELAPIIKAVRIGIKHRKTIITAAIASVMAVVLFFVMAIMVIVVVIFGKNANASCGTASGNDIIKFLQALSDQETGGTGDPTLPPNSGNASGKYQYIPGTWSASTETFYPPAHSYSQAYLAPEVEQDATAYLEYAKKFKDTGGDLFKLAVSHYYPAANEDPSLLDIIPHPEAGNVLTPREYAENFVQRVNSGAGSQIPVRPQDAPEFITYATQQNAPVPDSTDGIGEATGCVSGNAAAIVEKALLFAWPDQIGHESPDSSKPEYKAALDQYNPGGNPTDCGVFVSIVMRASGADPGYPPSGTTVQYDYVNDHPEKYTVIPGSAGESALQPGDIIIWSNPGDGMGHTLIYVGPQTGDYNSVDASFGNHTPQAESNPGYTLAKPGAIIARFIGGS